MEPSELHARAAVAGAAYGTSRPKPTGRSTRRLCRGPRHACSIPVGAIGDPVMMHDPTRLTAGIEPSDDPVLAVRRGVYEVSVAHRTGGWKGSLAALERAGCPFGHDAAAVTRRADAASLGLCGSVEVATHPPLVLRSRLRCDHPREIVGGRRRPSTREEVSAQRASRVTTVTASPRSSNAVDTADPTRPVAPRTMCIMRSPGSDGDAVDGGELPPIQRRGMSARPSRPSRFTTSGAAVHALGDFLDHLVVEGGNIIGLA